MNGERADTSSCWYVIHTHPNQEKRANSNLVAWGIETFAPKLKKLCHRYPGKTIYAAKPLFPRYIFARFDASKLLHKVGFTRGVESVVGFGNAPARVDDEIIFLIRSRIGKDGFVHIEAEVNPGDKVIIKDGPFKDFMAIFEQGVKDTDRVILLLMAVNYQCRVIVGREQIGNLSQSAVCANG